MEYLQIFRLLLVLAVASSAAAQSADWQVLQGIPAGTEIKVTLKHKRTVGHCEFVELTEDWLDCDFAALGFRRHERYERGEIRAVHLMHGRAKTGFAVGFGAGAILGAASTSGTANRAGKALFDGLLLGAIGAWTGWILHDAFTGKTVYRSPNVGSSKTPAKPQPSTVRKEKDDTEIPARGDYETQQKIPFSVGIALAGHRAGTSRRFSNFGRF